MIGGIAGARAARPEEAEAVLETLCAAFGLPVEAARPIFYGDPYYSLSHKRVLSQPDGGIVSCLTVVPMTLRVGGIPVPAAGVAGVATRPDYQRQGLAAALLQATVPALWEELGYPLSLLHPLSAPFYRRFGWETASHTVPWVSVPLSLPRSDKSPSVRPALETDWPAIFGLHAELTRNATGACVRDARRWQLIQMPIPGRETYVYENKTELAGYLICERREALLLMEMHGRTLAARRGLVAFLAHQPEPVIEWPTAPALLRAFSLPRFEAPPEPDVMLRIVDLGASLAAVHETLYAPLLESAQATLTLRVTDPLCPRNERPLRLTSDGPGLGKASDRPWLQTEIGTLARLYLGDWLPSEAATAGRLIVDAPKTLALADRLFPLREPYIAPLDQV